MISKKIISFKKKHLQPPTWRVFDHSESETDTRKLFIAQINKAEVLLNERKWKNSAQTQTLNALPLPGWGGCGCPPSLPARGQGQGQGRAGAGSAGRQQRSRLRGLFWLCTNAECGFRFCTNTGWARGRCPAAARGERAGGSDRPVGTRGRTPGHGSARPAGEKGVVHKVKHRERSSVSPTAQQPQTQ